MPQWTSDPTTYSQVFARLCAGAMPGLLGALIEKQTDLRGAWVLDVGAGTGEATSVIGAAGAEVVAVEPDGPTAQHLCQHMTRVVRAAFPALPFANESFDYALANFVVNHMDDPDAALQELTRVSRGPIAFSVWPMTGSRLHVVQQPFIELGIPEDPGAKLPADIDFERSTSGVAKLIERARLPVGEVREWNWQWRIEPKLLWSGVQAGIGLSGRKYVAQSAPVQAELDRLFRVGCQPYLSDGELTLDECAIIGVSAA